MNITTAELKSVSIQDFRKIKHIHHELQGAVTLVGGPNGNGKSSFIQAVKVAFEGKDALPTTPIRNGADKSVTVLTIDTNHGLLTATITDKPGGKHEITVESELGGKMPTPQTLLKELVSPFSGDPVALSRLEGKSLVEAVKKVCGIDFTEIDFRRQRAFDERKLANQDIVRLKGQLSGLPAVPADTPKAEQTADELNDQLTKAIEANAKGESLRAQAVAAETRLMSGREKITQKETDIARIKQEILLLEQRLDAEEAILEGFRIQIKGIETLADDARKIADEFSPTDLAPIQAKLAQIGDINKNVWKRAEREKVVVALSKAETESKRLTTAIEECDHEKDNLLRAAKLPIEGLQFRDDDLLLNGLSLSSDASEAERLKVTVPLVLAQCPVLKLVYCESGNDLDEDSLRELVDLVVAEGGHIMIERVGKTVEQVRLTLTEVEPIMMKNGESQ